MGTIRRVAAVVAALAGLAIASPAAADDRVLAPSDDWRLISRAESCALVRNFADARKNAARLELQRFAPDENFRIAMSGRGAPADYVRRGPAMFKYRFAPDPEERDGFGTAGLISGQAGLIFYADLATLGEMKRREQALAQGGAPESWRPYLLARESEVNRLALIFATRDDTVLEIGAMAEPLGRLRECTRALIAKWGYDIAVFEGLRGQPVLLNLPEVTSAVMALLDRARVLPTDAVHFRIDVTATATAGTCTVQFPRLGSEFEAAICQVVRDTARFEPAIGASGDPVRAPFFSSMRLGVR